MTTCWPPFNPHTDTTMNAESFLNEQEFVTSDYKDFEKLLLSLYKTQPRMIQMILDVLHMTGWKVNIPVEDIRALSLTEKARKFVGRWEKEIEETIGPHAAPSLALCASEYFMAIHTLACGLAVPYADSYGDLNPDY